MAYTNTLKRVNPYLELGRLNAQGIAAVGRVIDPTKFTLEDLVNAIGTYMDSIEYSNENRFEANLINTRGLAAVALNSFDDEVDTEDIEANSIKQLLELPVSDNFDSYIKTLSTIQQRSYGYNLNGFDERLLLMATAIGQANGGAWKDAIDNTSNWVPIIGKQWNSTWSDQAIRAAILFGMKGDLDTVLTASLTFSIYEAVKNKI